MHWIDLRLSPMACAGLFFICLLCGCEAESARETSTRSSSDTKTTSTKSSSDTKTKGSEAVSSFPVEHNKDLILDMNHRPQLFSNEKGLPNEAKLKLTYTRKIWFPESEKREFLHDDSRGVETYQIKKTRPSPFSSDQKEVPFKEFAIEVYFYSDGSRDVKVVPHVTGELVGYDKEGNIVREPRPDLKPTMFRVYADGKVAERSLRHDVGTAKELTDPGFLLANLSPVYIVEDRLDYCNQNPEQCEMVRNDNGRVSSMELSKMHPGGRLMLEESVQIMGWSSKEGIRFPTEVTVNLAPRHAKVTGLIHDTLYTLEEWEISTGQ